MSELRKNANVSSMLWAAYGDALGFPTELAGPDFVKKRIGTDLAFETVGWTRLVGGRFGAHVHLPAGTYSDDTQLRLAASRAIRTGGFFDVEAFAKVELPVWLSYGLGGGRGSKAAASSLGGRTANWFSNFFDAPGASYVRGGGNGAAMRIQPHVLAATNTQLERSSFLVDVVKNAVCTHGHARGISGAVIHAAALAHVLKHGSIPDPEHWMDLANVITVIPRIVQDEPDLSTFWLSTWERESANSLSEATQEAADEWAHSVGLAVSLLTSAYEDSYRAVVQLLGGLSDAERGSGLKCALFSLVAAWLYREQSPDDALKAVVNYLDSDTDTIATMVGALMGALPHQPPPSGKLQDRIYLEHEALRLYKISVGASVSSFQHPDLLYWQPPKTALDAVFMQNGKLTLAGLGTVKPISDEFTSNQKGTVFQWYALEFGQTVLCKRRAELKNISSTTGLKSSQVPTVNVLVKPDPPKVKPAHVTNTGDMFKQPVSVETALGSAPNTRLTLDQLTDAAIRSEFNAKLIGEHLLDLSEQENGIELAIGYVAIVVKAKKARIKRRIT